MLSIKCHSSAGQRGLSSDFWAGRGYQDGDAQPDDHLLIAHGFWMLPWTPPHLQLFSDVAEAHNGTATGKGKKNPTL